MVASAPLAPALPFDAAKFSSQNSNATVTARAVASQGPAKTTGERLDEQETFDSLDDAQAYLTQMSLMRGFKLTIGRHKSRKVYFLCNRYRALKCPCAYTVSHDSNDTWKFSSKRGEHNHELLPSALVNLKHREVPDALKERAVSLAINGVDFSSIVKIVKQKFPEATFLNKDVSNAI